jgi:hypothetical protein
MTTRRRPIAPIVLATIGLVVALALRPGPVREIVAAYVLALAAIALLALARLARTDEEWERTASELERALAPRKVARTRPSDLIRVERDIVLGTTNAGHFHARLRPLLWSIATARTRSPQEALGDEMWELLRPDRGKPADLYAEGLSVARVREIVDALERL